MNLSILRGFYLLLLMSTLGWLLVGCKQDQAPASAQTPDRRTLLQEGRAKLSSGDLSGAEESFRQYLKEMKPLWRAIQHVASLYRAAEKPTEGYQLLRQSIPDIEKLPAEEKSIAYMHIAAFLYLTKVHRDDSLTYFEKAYQADPRNHQNLNDYSYALAELDRDLAKAQRLATQAITLQPNQMTYHDSLGWVYYRQGKYREALRELKLVADVLASNAEVRYHLAAVFYKLGRLQSAEIEASKAVSLDANLKEAKQLLQQIERQK